MLTCSADFWISASLTNTSPSETPRMMLIPEAGRRNTHMDIQGNKFQSWKSYLSGNEIENKECTDPQWKQGRLFHPGLLPCPPAPVEFLEPQQELPGCLERNAQCHSWTNRDRDKLTLIRALNTTVTNYWGWKCAHDSTCHSKSPSHRLRIWAAAIRGHRITCRKPLLVPRIAEEIHTQWETPSSQ